MVLGKIVKTFAVNCKDLTFGKIVVRDNNILFYTNNNIISTYSSSSSSSNNSSPINRDD